MAGEKKAKGTTNMEVGGDGVALITIVNPPVNALSYDGTLTSSLLFSFLGGLRRKVVIFKFAHLKCSAAVWFLETLGFFYWEIQKFGFCLEYEQCLVIMFFFLPPPVIYSLIDNYKQAVQRNDVKAIVVTGNH